MSSIHSHVRPHSSLFLRLPSGHLKCLENLQPHMIIEVGKLGSFPSDLLLGRPYYHTYELLEKRENEAYSRVRIVSPSELNAEVGAEGPAASEDRDESATPPSGNGVPEGYDLVGDDGSVIMKNNRLTIDDASRQALSQVEIEELKKSAGGREIVDKILANHAGLDEKTVFSKAKYTLRKTKKYLKRFTVLPMDVGNLVKWVTEKEPSRILEMREEMVGLIGAWSNTHFSGTNEEEPSFAGVRANGGRCLVVDETGGLVVAALAERMGTLFTEPDDEAGSNCSNLDTVMNGINAPSSEHHADAGVAVLEDHTAQHHGVGQHPPPPQTSTPKGEARIHRDFPLPAYANSITLIHPAVQPNISVLKYFGYDANQPDPTHPLHEHLKPLSWLQLLHPHKDPTYREPERVNEAELQGWKSGKRGTYWKKRRRWERCKAIVDEARAGGFESLVVASSMDPASIMPHVVALVRGGGHVVVYSPTIEPLVKLIDLYSKERRTAYIHHLSKGETPDVHDFPVDPRLLLAATVQTSRVREWQVLPGRTHPLMTGKGGAEGFVFTARRVIPLEGGVEARGNFSAKRRKVGIAGTPGSIKTEAESEYPHSLESSTVAST